MSRTKRFRHTKQPCTWFYGNIHQYQDHCFYRNLHYAIHFNSWRQWDEEKLMEWVYEETAKDISGRQLARYHMLHGYGPHKYFRQQEKRRERTRERMDCRKALHDFSFAEDELYNSHWKKESGYWD